MKVRSDHTICEMVYDSESLCIWKVTRGFNLDIWYEIRSKHWTENPGLTGPVVSMCRSLLEAQYVAKGIEQNNFIPVPWPNEFAKFPGLEEKVLTGN